MSRYEINKLWFIHNRKTTFNTRDRVVTARHRLVYSRTVQAILLTMVQRVHKQVFGVRFVTASRTVWLSTYVKRVYISSEIHRSHESVNSVRIIVMIILNTTGVTAERANGLNYFITLESVMKSRETRLFIHILWRNSIFKTQNFKCN